MARIRSLALATALTLLLASAATAAPGDLDESFGGDGIATYDWGGVDFSVDVLVQPDGRIVVSGSGGPAGDVFVERVTAAGNPDPAFSGDGIASFAFDDFDSGDVMARQPDGKILVAVYARNPMSAVRTVVMRLNADGTPDGSFGSGGMAALAHGGTFEYASAMLVQPDGRIVVAGTGGPTRDWVVARLTPQGELDPSFDGDGRVLLDFGGSESATAVVLQPDGKLVVGGSLDGGGVAVVRLNADGGVDTGFAAQGRLLLQPHTGDRTSDVLVQPDGKILVVGAATGDAFLVTRVNPDGSVDDAFGGEGTASVGLPTSDTDNAQAAVLQANGKIVVAGYTTTGQNNKAAVARLQPGGSVDTTFGSAGWRTLPGTGTWAYGVALQPDGRIVATGDNGEDTLVFRLQGDNVQAGGGPAGGGGGPGGGPGGGGGVAQVPRCAGKRATIVGTTRPDRLKGTRRADVIVALGGSDRIAAGRGNDLICAGDGNDRIDGGSGNDRLYGQDGTDTLGGGSGRDALSGGNGKDKLSGGGGKDRCAGNAGRDRADCERGRA